MLYLIESNNWIRFRMSSQFKELIEHAGVPDGAFFVRVRPHTTPQPADNGNGQQLSNIREASNERGFSQFDSLPGAPQPDSRHSVIAPVLRSFSP